MPQRIASTPACTVVSLLLAGLGITTSPLWPASVSALPPETAAIESAHRAAHLCRAKKLDEASKELRILVGTLEGDLGAGHSATRIARLNLASVDTARGQAPPDRDADSGTKNEDESEIAPALARALKGLRACVAPARVRRTPESDESHRAELRRRLSEEPLESQIAAARRLASQGRYRDALQIAQSAATLADVGTDLAARMRANESLALIQLQLGDAAAALAAAHTAEQYARQTDALESRITMARLLAQAGDLEGARGALEELSSRVQSTRLAAELEEARGDLQIRLGSPGRAMAHLERALAGHRSAFGETHASTAAVLQLEGDAARQAGDYATALGAYRRTLETRREILPTRHPDIARTRNAIGVLRADFGDWQAADRAFSQALSDLRVTLGEQHPETVTVRANRALARWGGEQSAEAADDYEEVAEKLQMVMGHDHPTGAEALRNLARMRLELGEADRAQALLDRALASQLRVLGEAHPASAPTRLARADLLRKRGQPDQARSEIDKAARLLRQAYGDEHPLVARAWLAAADASLALGDATRAWSQASRAAHIVGKHVRRSFGAMSDRQRVAAAQDTSKVVGTALSVPGVAARDTYLAILPHRDSVLRSIAAGRASDRERDAPTRAILEKLAGLREGYAAAVLGATPELAARAQELAAEIDSLQSRAALADVAQREREPLDVLLAACAHLPADGALVEFVAFDRHAAGHSGPPLAAYAAIVIRGAGCHVERVDLGPAETIDRISQRFSQSMREQRSDAARERAELARLLISPLEQALGTTSRWLVIPDASLWGLPLGALPDPQDANHYLLERVTLGYLTSIHELADAPDATAEAAPTRALLFGAPEFGAGPEAGGPVVLTASGPCRIPPFEPLPGTHSELQAVGALLGETRSVMGEQATKARLRSELASRPEILHLATHAYFAGQAKCDEERALRSAWRSGESIAPNPLLLSGIVLAGANREARLAANASSERDSGILTAFEAAGLDLRGSRLVVLSACDTGTGLHQRGQEVQGLRWGFRAAGARALVTSLWRSNDFATRRLMKNFYTALASPDLPRDAFRGAEALRRAQLEHVRAEGRLGLKKPLVWANFVISGLL